MKGFPEPVHAYRVVRESAIESRFEALHGTALTPLVGREEEIDLLRRQWNRAKRGEGRVVLLSGEPGIDKSRLTAALQMRRRTLVLRRPHEEARLTPASLYLFYLFDYTIGFCADSCALEWRSLRLGLHHGAKAFDHPRR